MSRYIVVQCFEHCLVVDVAAPAVADHKVVARCYSGSYAENRRGAERIAELLTIADLLADIERRIAAEHGAIAGFMYAIERAWAVIRLTRHLRRFAFQEVKK